MDHDYFPIHEAIQQGNANLALQLLRDQPKQVLRKDQDDRTPLHWACSRGDLKLVKAILSDSEFARYKEDVLEEEDASGWTPLHIAVSTDNRELVQLLLDAGADVDATTGLGTTVLHLAALKLHSVLPLVLGTKFRPDNAGYTPLHRAAAAGSQPVVSALVEAKGPLIVNKTDKQGWTALHQAMTEGHGDLAVWLLQHGADPLVKSPDGETAYDVAPPKVREFVMVALSPDPIG